MRFGCGVSYCRQSWLVYAQAGIEDYWVVNLRDGQGPAQEGHRCVILYRNLAEGRYQLEQTVFSGEISPLAFPNVSISVHDLLG